MPGRAFSRWLVVVCLLAGVRAARGEVVTLTGEGWAVAVDPATLGVTATPVGGTELVVSAPRATPVKVAELRRDAAHVRWAMPDERLSAEMCLAGDTLVVRFAAEAAGAFEWPVVVAPASPDAAYVLPMFEGLYVPAGDAQWIAHLVHESPVDTLGGLSMPLWGVRAGGRTLTYLATHPFNNEITFEPRDGRLAARFRHTFTPNRPVKEFGFRISLGGGSPVEPARRYRQHLVESGQFVTLKQKIDRTPDTARLLGAAHVYLWGDGLLSRHDVKDYKALARQILQQAQAEGESIGKRLWSLMNAETRTLVEQLPSQEWVDEYTKGQLTAEISRVLELPEFGDGDRARLFHDAFASALHPVDTWGDGVSPKMVQTLADAGLDRLWLGTASWVGLQRRPETVRRATSVGYLIGPYDSYHSIHAPGEADTWETAQFDRRLYDTGAIQRADGTKLRGFKKKGYKLSPLAARPYVERRVSGLMNEFRANSWFVDCDAFGEVYDDYSPLHPATQADDMHARLARLRWIEDTFDAVVGSEGGSSYAAGAIAFAHGMMTPVVAWGDPDLYDKATQSPHYLGAYYPPDGPAMFFKRVPMKPAHRRTYADPRFRLPLYQTVFHDAVVATHHWSADSLKFEDPTGDRALLELLYNVPPMYHLNLAEWTKRRDAILRHYAFFSPLHRRAGLLPMTDFAWLTDDRLVQRTTFGDGELELVANFADDPFQRGAYAVPPHSIIAVWRDGPSETYSPVAGGGRRAVK